jgi:hypothetical protein
VSTNYPTSKDTFPIRSALINGTLSARGHAQLHEDLGDAVRALEDMVGVTASTDAASHDARISAVEAGKIGKTLYQANSIIASTGAATPVSVTMGTNSILARLAGNVVSASPSQILALIDAQPHTTALDQLNLLSAISQLFSTPALTYVQADGAFAPIGLSGFMLEILTSPDGTSVRDEIGAAGVVHNHDVSEIDNLHTLVNGTGDIAWVDISPEEVQGTVTGLRGVTLDATPATRGDAYVYTSSAFVPTPVTQTLRVDPGAASYSNNGAAVSLFGNGTYTIPGGTLQVNDFIVLEAYGTYINNSLAGRDFTLSMTVGGVQVGGAQTSALGAGLVPPSASPRSWRFRAMVRMHSVGAGATTRATTVLSVGEILALGPDTLSSTANQNSSTFNSTTDLVVDLKSTLANVATPTQTFKCEGIFLSKTSTP